MGRFVFSPFFFLFPIGSLLCEKKKQQRGRNISSLLSENQHDIRRAFGANSFAEGIVETYAVADTCVQRAHMCAAPQLKCTRVGCSAVQATASEAFIALMSRC